jgi:nitroreductase
VTSENSSAARKVRGFFDVALSQRACRAFTAEDVPDDVVRRVLTAATHAPSAENTQPWRFVVVRDQGLRARIGELAAKAWTGGGRKWSEGRLPEPMLADVDQGARGGVASAPVLVVVAADTSHVAAPALEASIWPAVQNLLLAAIAEGLGSALTTLPTSFPRDLADLVGLPEHVRPMAVVPLGHPAAPLAPPRRRPVDEVAFAERWGEPL